MKRRDLMKRIISYARRTDQDLRITEGANHTKVKLGERQAVVARHSEISDLTAKGIFKQLGME
ncbi:hypothetical protein [Propionimicrobium sp. PCR01-08-3]|uniref:hypothetical protein n=1 Tax=Propionimicrobium sp. PCR01-08-3 TaxID=3052086 RepID=UPI00255CF3AB|nr:hypothetical protein [Propionimicrobium sp. PCR01-08-3]WIY81768.1 hypothetical protein QQ658_09560 [Propionimicrobium sp. PCR01-08-3]